VSVRPPNNESNANPNTAVQVVFPRELPVTPFTAVAKPIRPVTCTAWADPHYTTWDNGTFDFFHIGTYYMVCETT
jgi:hypothetical protein